MTCPDADTLAALEALAAPERAAIVDHAANCAACRPIVMALVGLGETQAFAEAATLASTEPPAGAAPAMPPAIDRYRIERRIGEGAMGVVFAAHDPELDRRVAIKVLRVGGSPERMKREAQALAKLTHPNVVAVHDVGEHAGATFVAMALVDGENLRTWLAGERSTAQILDAIVQAARGVDAAHQAGIVHRDLKPDNIFVARSGAVLVGDFGLARSDGDPRSPVAPTTASAELTRTGSVVGTPAYMAPEQIEGEASEASDQFALCVTAWEALYGARPFRGASIGELAQAMRRGPPPEPRGRTVPAHVRAAIRRGIAALPADRHPSMAALLAALVPRRRRRWPYVAIALAAAAGATAAVALRGDPQRDVIASCERQGAPEAWSGARRTRALARLETQGMAAPLRTQAAMMLDRHATEWTALARSTCIANAKREVSDPVHAAVARCLARRAAMLAWAIDEPTLEPMVRLAVIEALEPVEACRTNEATPAPAPALAAMQLELDRAIAQAAVGNVDLVDLAALHRQVAAIDDPGVTAQASYLEAVLQRRGGRDPEQALRRAITNAEVARDDRVRTRATAMLAGVLARSGQLREATVQRDIATSSLTRNPDAVTKVVVEGAIAAVAAALRDGPAELAALQRIEALEVARLGEDAFTVANARFAVAACMQKIGHPDGVAVSNRAFAGYQKLHGQADTDSPEALLMSLHREAAATKDLAAKVAVDERALVIARAQLPAQLPSLLHNLATSYMLLGDYDRAILHGREALARIATSLDPRDAGYRLDTLDNLVDSAYLAAARTDDKEARARNITQVHAALGELPAERREADYNLALLGRTMLLEGRHADAVAPLTAAFAVAEREDPQNPYRVFVRAFALAEALWESGSTRDRVRARALADQATARLPDARAYLAAAEHAAGARDTLERIAIRLEAWRRTHR